VGGRDVLPCGIATEPLFLFHSPFFVLSNPDCVLQLSAFMTKHQFIRLWRWEGQQHCFLLFLFFSIDTPSNSASLFIRFFFLLLFLLHFLLSTSPVLFFTSFLFPVFFSSFLGGTKGRMTARAGQGGGRCFCELGMGNALDQ
jgi:hypothetical protein